MNLESNVKCVCGATLGMHGNAEPHVCIERGCAGFVRLREAKLIDDPVNQLAGLAMARSFNAPLPEDAAARKATPIAMGVLAYFPDAIAAVAHVSWVGNQQHNPGQPLHWDRSKSTDELDALIRHALHELVQPGSFDTSGQEPVLHAAKVAWRALAHLQKTIEAQKARPSPEAIGHVAGVP